MIEFPSELQFIFTDGIISPLFGVTTFGVTTFVVTTFGVTTFGVTTFVVTSIGVTVVGSTWSTNIFLISLGTIKNLSTLEMKMILHDVL